MLTILTKEIADNQNFQLQSAAVELGTVVTAEIRRHRNRDIRIDVGGTQFQPLNGLVRPFEFGALRRATRWIVHIACALAVMPAHFSC